ncbi:MUS308 and mammalian DNA polymerase-like protein isoform X2 [Tasmannia lanceolata]|uniref:MUS308 and mammalian DNA polymerase-like protein isoform X2 n=1 Tax=Tasmannia lanceolata TaxID=3420 RepID=UPI004063BBB8
MSSSGSPQTLIDQFFTSRKRRPLLPCPKDDKTGKVAKNALDGSPSAKGTLDNYLVNSHEDNCLVKPPHANHGAMPREGPVKRNLTLEINLASEVINGPIFSSNNLGSEEHSQKVESLGEVKKETLHEISTEGIEPDKHDDVVTRSRKENLELKGFAEDFLSLYCSELPSSVSSPTKQKLNAQERNACPSLLISSSKTSKKQCLSVCDQFPKEVANTRSDQESPENVKSGDAVIGLSGYLEGTDSKTDKEYESTCIGAHSGLKKSNKTPNSSLHKAKCYTPGSSANLLSKNETPKWVCRGSLFSPGDAFWNEAVEVVEGLIAPVDKFSVQLSKGIITVVNGESSRNGRCDQNVSRSSEGDVTKHLKLNASVESSKVHSEENDFPGIVSHNEASPLPVRHFDFSFEDKNLDGNFPENASDLAIGKGKGGFLSKENDSEAIDGKKKLFPGLPVAHSDTSKIPEIKVKSSSTAYSKYNEASTPSSSMPLNDCLQIKSWLPSELCNIYSKRGISKLYPWQVDCLLVDGVLQKRNLVYCASTSAGKSFVAEILMLRRVISTGKIALLVLPYVSICAEKAEHLEGLLEPLGKRVCCFYGNQGGGTLPKDTSVAVCTIEKANFLINRLLEEGRLSEVGIVVIDELHMVGDQTRGYLLELMLTKLRYASGEGNIESISGESSGSSSGKADPANGLQVVGMSATMPNVAAVADWLQAALYQTDFRPVPLEEYYKVGNAIFNREMVLVRTIPKSADLGGKDPDHIVELCNEVIQEGHSVLLFCSSRKGCESTARHVSKFLKKFPVRISEGVCEFSDAFLAVEALRRCPAGLDPILEETFPSGVAYHHAGLTVEEREIVETCYRKGLVRVLTATSTLAAGVNLPARRVIFRQPRIGRDFIDGTRYRQMAGRAGRTGIDTKGESILICKPEEVKRITALLNDDCPPLQSCLSEDKNGMTHAILEVVAGGIVQTSSDIHRYVRCTLLNSTKPFQDVVKSAQDSLRWLCHRKFLEWNEETKLYSTTPLGRASFGSSLSPEESLVVLDDLSRAREGFVLASDLHLVYLVTPINVDVEPDWELYYERFMELSTLDQSVGNRIGIVEPFLMRMAHGAPVHIQDKSKWNKKRLNVRSQSLTVAGNGVLSDEQMLRVSKRFYVALMLLRLVQEVSVVDVCDVFKVSRGMVQALQENAGRFALMVSLFCERLGWHDLEGLVSKFQNRVSFGVRAEIAELTNIPYVKGSRARALYKAGLRTPLAIAEASVPEIVKALFESSSWAAQEGSAMLRIQLGLAKKIKNGARKIVLEQAEEARLAAFSAFKSLGVNVPQLSLPLLSNTAGNSIMQEGGLASSDYGGEKLARTSDIGGVQYSCSDVNPGILVKDSSLTCGPGFRLKLENADNGNTIPSGYLDQEQHEKNSGGDYHTIDRISDKGPTSVSNIPGGFDSFLDLWDATKEFYFDVHFTKRSEQNSLVPFEIHGIAICWENSPVYYVNLSKDLVASEKLNLTRKHNHFHGIAAKEKTNIAAPIYLLEVAKQRWKRITNIMERVDVRKITWNLKIQIQVLKSPGISIQKFSGLSSEHREKFDIELIDNSYLLLHSLIVHGGIDMCLVAWILWPDEESNSSQNLEKEVKKRLSSEAAAAANRDGRWRNQMRRAAHNGCCRRVAQTRALGSVLWKLLISEDLVEPLTSIESPLVNVLADMEFWGIGVDMEACLRARHILGKKLKELEKEAYNLAGIAFSLYTAADIADVLYRRLKLPITEGCKKGKQHPSTDKHSLDLLRHQHPIVSVIKEHRTLSKLLNCTLGSICSQSRLCVRSQKYTVHGHWLQTSTATGRLSMEEPNLQCVEHTVDFASHHIDKNSSSSSDAESHQINPRDFFTPTQDNWLLLAADYSQIELRLMAHFSKDSSLIELLSKTDGDVFRMMAARWTGQLESTVSSMERNQMKRLVYGILYGMGANTLAEQLDCTSDEASENIQSFKKSFPGVSAWLHEAVASCRQKGYVVTLKGRKRFLSKIKFGNSKEKAKARRQSVNSICQGSAADIIKIAMINIHSLIVHGYVTPNSSISDMKKFSMLKGHCRILLQVHDELVLEVDPSLVREAGLLLKLSMESAVSLMVPLHVKLKVGRTWGSMEPFDPDLSKEVLVQCP